MSIKCDIKNNEFKKTIKTLIFDKLSFKNFGILKNQLSILSEKFYKKNLKDDNINFVDFLRLLSLAASNSELSVSEKAILDKALDLFIQKVSTVPQRIIENRTANLSNTQKFIPLFNIKLNNLAINYIKSTLTKLSIWDGSKIISSVEDLNKALYKFQNKLFRDVCNYVESNSDISVSKKFINLISGTIDYENYSIVMELMNKILNNKYLNNLQIDLNLQNNGDELIPIINFYLLNNFDKIIGYLVDDVIVIKNNKNSLILDLEKYSLIDEKFITQTFNENSMLDSADFYTNKLLNKFLYSIEISGQNRFLSTNDLNQIYSVLNRMIKEDKDIRIYNEVDEDDMSGESDYEVVKPSFLLNNMKTKEEKYNVLKAVFSSPDFLSVIGANIANSIINELDNYETAFEFATTLLDPNGNAYYGKSKQSAIFLNNKLDFVTSFLNEISIHNGKAISIVNNVDEDSDNMAVENIDNKNKSLIRKKIFNAINNNFTNNNLNYYNNNYLYNGVNVLGESRDIFSNEALEFFRNAYGIELSQTVIDDLLNNESDLKDFFNTLYKINAIVKDTFNIDSYELNQYGESFEINKLEIIKNNLDKELTMFGPYIGFTNVLVKNNLNDAVKMLSTEGNQQPNYVMPNISNQHTRNKRILLEEGNKIDPNYSIANCNNIFINDQGLKFNERSENSDYQVPIVLRLEVVTQEDPYLTVIEGNKLRKNESLQISLNIEFLKNMIYKNIFLTQTVCPSDKPSINTRCINTENLFNNPLTNSSMSNNEILELSFNQNKQYYNLIQKDIINKYNKLFPELELDTVSPQLALNKIILKLSQYNNLEEFNKDVSLFLQENPEYEFTEGVDYCTRKGKVFFNCELLYYLRLYNSSINDYRKHLNIGFENFINTLKNSDISFLKINDVEAIQDKLKFLCDLDSINLPNKSNLFKGFINSLDNSDDSLTWADLLNDKKYKPFVENMLIKYFYLSELVRNADKQLTTKFSYSHDAKSDSIIINDYINKQLSEEEQLNQIETIIVNNIDNYKDEGNEPGNLLAKEMSSRFKTSTKRENGYVATYIPYNTDSMWGCPKISRMATVPDITEELINYIGDKINQDLQDGAIGTSGIAAQWEMRSQFGKELTESKKVIGFVSRFNSMTQIKCADFPFSNAMLRMCWKDKQFDVFKLLAKMHSLPLITKNENSEIEYNIAIKAFENISKLNELEKFYRYINNQLYQFNSIKVENDNLIIEWLNTEDNSVLTKVVYDGSEEQFTVNDLWEKLGGYSTYSYNENHELVPDESSMIFLADLLSISDGYYGTDLKTKLISKMCWNTTVKAAATNRNSKQVLINDEPLNYSIFEYASFGMQNDSTHLVDDSEMANPSQVETAIAFNGLNVERSKEVYDAISEIVKQGLDEIVNEFQLIDINETDPEDTKIKKRKAFEIAMAKNLIRTLESSADVSSAMSLIRKILNNDEDFNGDISLSISNPNLFHKIEQVLMSALNSGAIKLKQSGTASVINPSRGMIKVFEYNNLVLSKKDILNIIHNDDTYKDPIYSDYNDHDLIADYLERHKDEFNKSNCNISDLNIADIIEVDYNELSNSNVFSEKEINTFLNSNGMCRIEINNPIILKKVENLIDNGCNIIKCNYLGRDIRPRNITWDLEIDGKIIHRNIWTHDIVQDLIKFKLDHEDDLENPEIKKVYNFKLLKFRQLLALLGKGMDYYNGKYYNITNFNNRPGELILGKVNRTKHHIGEGTLYDIKSNPNYYDEIINSELDPIYSLAYKDAIYTYGTSENFDIIFANEFSPSEKFEKIKIITRNNNYYAIDNNGNELFLVSHKNLNIYKMSNINGKDLFVIQSDPNILKNSIRLIQKQLNALYLNQDKFDYDDNYIKHIKKFNTINVNSSFPIDINDNTIKENIKEISKNLYNSFLMCNECTSLRIPSQSYQSFMGMETVAFTEANTNDCYVNIWEIWFQGSDHDIDKAYTLMYSLNKLGHIEMFSPLAKLNNKKNIELSLDLPLPNKESMITSLPDSDQTISLETIINKLIDQDLLSSNDLDKIGLSYNNLKDINLILREINKLTKWGITVNNNNELLNPLVEKLNLHNKFTPSKNGYLNKIVRNIYTSSLDIKNLEYSILPMSADSYRKVTEDIENERGIGENNQIVCNTNPADIFSIMENNSVGKGGVGIFANGVKVVGSVHQIYNEFYFNKHELELLRKDPIYNKYFSDDKLKINEKYLEFINNEKYKKLNICLKRKNEKGETIETGLKFTIPNQKTNQNLIIQKDGPITSLANVKTYGLEKSNKYNETLSPEELVKLFSISEEEAKLKSQEIELEENVADKISILISLATDNAKELMLARINSFEELSNGVIALTTLGFTLRETLEISINLFKPIADQLHVNRLKNPFKLDIIKIIDNLNFDLDTKESLKIIFEFGKELTTLAMFYKMNQGLKSKFNDIEQFKLRLNKHKENLMKLAKISSEQDIIKQFNLNSNNLTESQKESQKRKIQYILNPFDPYLFATDKEYLTAMKDLNNLNGVKTGINVFDCILESPHYNEMLKAFSVIQNKIQKKSIKAMFVDYAMNPASFRHKILLEANIPNEKSLRKDIERDNLNWMTSMVDHYVIDQFLQTLTLFQFKMKNIHQFLRSINVTKSDLYDISENIIVDLKSKTGIEIFMKLMTNYVIPHLKNTNNNNLFLKNLKEETMKRSDIIVYNLNLDLFNISSKEDENVMNNIKSDFLNLSKQLFDIKNTLNKSIYLGDIFYMYNLIAHKNSLNNLSAIAYLYDDVYHKSTLNNFEALLSNKYAEIDNLPEKEKIKICHNLYDTYLVSRNKNKKGFSRLYNLEIDLKNAYLYTKPYINIVLDINKKFQDIIRKKYVNLKIEIVC